jgi:uncharacterized protein (DUF362 family)
MCDVFSADAPVFDFPERVRRARTVLIKPNVGYPAQAPVIVRMALLRTLVEQVLAIDADKRVIITEGVCTKIAAEQVFNATGLAALAGPRVDVLDAERLPMRDYVNPMPRPNRFAELRAPALIDEVDARISIAPFKRTVLNGAPLISATIKNLYGLLPRETYRARSPHARGKLHLPNVHRVIVDVYHTLGARFDFGVVDLCDKYVCDDWQPDRGRAIAVGHVVAGSRLIDVDLRACEVAAEPRCAYLDALAATQ